MVMEERAARMEKRDPVLKEVQRGTVEENGGRDSSIRMRREGDWLFTGDSKKARGHSPMSSTLGRTIHAHSCVLYGAPANLANANPDFSAPGYRSWSQLIQACNTRILVVHVACVPKADVVQAYGVFLDSGLMLALHYKGTIDVLKQIRQLML